MLLICKGLETGLAHWELSRYLQLRCDFGKFIFHIAISLGKDLRYVLLTYILHPSKIHVSPHCFPLKAYLGFEN
jgi:hypothetical protein